MQEISQPSVPLASFHHRVGFEQVKDLVSHLIELRGMRSDGCRVLRRIQRNDKLIHELGQCARLAHDVIEPLGFILLDDLLLLLLGVRLTGLVVG